MESISRPYTLSIAGFDPSGGAGLLADIKTFEALGVYGFGIVSALTYQNESFFSEVEWINSDKIIKQLEVLFLKHKVKHFKIGLIQSFGVLIRVLDFIYEKVADPVIIFDPITSTSSGFSFASDIKKHYKEIMEEIYLITPNIPEATEMFGENFSELKLVRRSSLCNIYLKGGHAIEDICKDTLYSNGKKFTFTSPRLPTGKHGSGCVLSSAILAGLAKGKELEEACRIAIDYTHQFLASNNTLLGYHQILTEKEYA
jgi:hydroxymethylpyrimidine/phosphomethylpyrimidine kinase